MSQLCKKCILICRSIMLIICFHGDGDTCFKNNAWFKLAYMILSLFFIISAASRYETFK